MGDYVDDCHNSRHPVDEKNNDAIHLCITSQLPPLFCHEVKNEIETLQEISDSVAERATNVPEQDLEDNKTGKCFVTSLSWIQ